MKKREILKLIEANRIIQKNSNLISIAHNENNKLIEPKYWFPNIEELKEEFSILQKEVQNALDETINNKKYIKKVTCNHDIRLEHYGIFVHHSKCIFCDETIISDNCINWEYSINRNKYSVTFTAKYQDDEECEDIKEGYTKEQLYQIIIDILKDKQDEEEIDLIQEFKRLNLKNCRINEERKVNENYILIINGSNKQFIDKDSYIHKKTKEIGLYLTKYFSSLLNIKVELIDNLEILENKTFINYFNDTNSNIKFQSYDTIKKLEEILTNQKNIPFKIIIDLSELYEYKIIDNKIYKENKSINLNEIFPNSYIIKTSNLTEKKHEYHYLEKENLTKENIKNTCVKIKKLLR